MADTAAIYTEKEFKKLLFNCMEGTGLDEFINIEDDEIKLIHRDYFFFNDALKLYGIKNTVFTSPKLIVVGNFNYLISYYINPFELNGVKRFIQSFEKFIVNLALNGKVDIEDVFREVVDAGLKVDIYTEIKNNYHSSVYNLSFDIIYIPEIFTTIEVFIGPNSLDFEIEALDYNNELISIIGGGNQSLKGTLVSGFLMSELNRLLLPRIYDDASERKRSFSVNHPLIELMGRKVMGNHLNEPMIEATDLFEGLKIALETELDATVSDVLYNVGIIRKLFNKKHVIIYFKYGEVYFYYDHINKKIVFDSDERNIYLQVEQLEINEESGLK